MALILQAFEMKIRTSWHSLQAGNTFAWLRIENSAGLACSAFLVSNKVTVILYLTENVPCVYYKEKFVGAVDESNCCLFWEASGHVITL